MADIGTQNEIYLRLNLHPHNVLEKFDPQA